MENQFKFEKNLARQDFERAKNKAAFNKIVKNIFRENNSLFQFDEVKYLLSPHGMSYRGVQTIPIEKIVGSEGRYQDFDLDFLPNQKHTRGRWENIDIMRMRDVNLPPISVYKLGEFYFVRDGNHRVSVARERGQEYIDAEIVELYSRVGLKEEKLSEKSLLIAESNRYFLEKSRFDIIFPGQNIELTHPWSYYRLLEHINTYKYLKSQEEGEEMPWDEAVREWYENVFSRVAGIIRESAILNRFQGRTEGDLYIWVMDHWHFLKERYGEHVELSHAVKDYSHKYGAGFFRRAHNRLWDWIKKLFVGKKG